MNLKLKGIEIEAFRVYQDKQLFNFLDKSGEVANLVVIYAPNGYGKTSFIDAVEWSLTGNINRISKNSVVKNAAESEQGIILKNRKSQKDYGTVKIITENSGFLEKRTKQLGRYGRKSDYADGDIIVNSGIFSNLNFSHFASKSILGQDKIDSFLRSFTPRDRYDMLTNFWDDANDSEIFKSILGMHSESEKKISETEKQLVEIRDAIQCLVIHPSIVTEINSLVSTFNCIQLEDLFLIEFDRKNHREFISTLISTMSKVELVNSTNKSDLTTSNYLVSNYITYSLKNQELSEIQKDIGDINSILNKFQLKDEKIQDLNKVLSKAYNVYKRYKDLKKLKEEHQQYDKVLMKIRDLEESNLSLVNNISRLSKCEVQEGQTIKNLQDLLQTTQESKEELHGWFLALDKNIYKYSTLKSKEKHLTRRLNQLQELMDTRWSKIEELKTKTLELKSYSRFEAQNLIKVHTADWKINEIISKLEDKLNIKYQKEQDLQQIEDDYLQFGKLNEQLNAIFKAGKSFIEDSSTSTCPLCKKKYEDFNTLINNVNRDFVDLNKLNTLKFQIDNMKGALEEEDKDINEIMSLIKQQIYNNIDILSVEILVHEGKISSYNLLNQKIDYKLGNIRLSLDILRDSFQKVNIDIRNQDLGYLADVKSSITKKLDEYDELVSKCSGKIVQRSEEKKKLLDKLNENQLQLVSNQNEIRELYTNPVLNNVRQLLDKLQIDNSTDRIGDETRWVKQSVLSCVYDKRIITEEINKLDREIVTKDRTSLLELLDQKKQALDKVQEYLENYGGRIRKFKDENSVTKEDLQQIHNDHVRKKESIQKGLDILSNLIVLSRYIENNIELKTKKSAREALENQLKLLKKGNKELSNAKGYITKHIENKINTAFNLDSINSIYQRIDPHPDFNNIKFETNLTKEKPELYIYAADKQEKLAPILYFSAAQVNILSLSIFLARALIEENDGLNTIFMDDPIQHLDNLNILSFIDLLRTITLHLDKQVVLSTHNENFFKLMKRKMDPDFTNSKFIELESFGKVKAD